MSNAYDGARYRSYAGLDTALCATDVFDHVLSNYDATFDILLWSQNIRLVSKMIGLPRVCSRRYDPRAQNLRPVPQSRHSGPSLLADCLSQASQGFVDIVFFKQTETRPDVRRTRAVRQEHCPGQCEHTVLVRLGTHELLGVIVVALA